MTKLEERLLELGYQDYQYYYQKTRWINDTFVIVQISKDLKGSIKDLFVNSQEHINNIQQAYNEMQKDLAVLKEVLENDN